MRHLWLFLLLLLLLLLLSAVFCQQVEESDAVTLTIYRGKYITLLVGASGREVTLRVRFDVDDLVLYMPPAPSDYSTSAELNPDGFTGTEVFYIGPRMYRWPVLYASPGSLGEHDSDETGDRVSHQGVLGLGPQSPLWREWNSWTWSRVYLTLGNIEGALARTADLIWYHQDGSDGRLVACWDDGQQRCARVRPSPENDFTYMSADVYIDWMQHHDSLELQPYSVWLENPAVQGCSALWSGNSDDQCRPGNTVYTHMYLDSSIADDNELSLRKVRMSYEDLGDNVTLPEEQIFPGLEHLSTMILSRDLITDRLAIASLPLWFLRRTDYVWMLASLVVVLMIWYPGTYEHVHSAHWRTDTSAKPLARLIPDIALSTQLWVTRIVMWVSLAACQWTFKPYYAMRMIDHPYASTPGWSDLIYALLVGYVLVVSIFAVPLVSRRSVSHIASALFCCCWLVLVLEFQDGMNGILLVVSSGMLFIIQCDMLSYALYRRNGKPRSALYILSSGLSTLASAWFFAFYNVATYIESKWPGQPSSLPIQMLVLFTVWTLCSYLPFVEEHAVHYEARVDRYEKKLNKKTVTDKPTSPEIVVVSSSSRAPYVFNSNPADAGTMHTYSPVLAIAQQ